MSVMTETAARLGLKDADLLRGRCYVDGQWIDADSGKTIDVTNPADGSKLGTVPAAGEAETRRAIEAANRAYPAWRAKTAKERAKILRTWFDLMMANQEDLARIMTAEQGKPIAELRGEIAYAASFIEWFGEEAKRVYGDTIPAHLPGRRLVVTKEPVGVCAAITPWNFPAAMITRKAGPALAAGCPIVIKPATATPYSAFAMAVLAERAGVPGRRAERADRFGQGDRRGDDDQPAGPQADLHRLDRDRQAVDVAVRRHGEEGLAGTGRQCAVHRVRRRRPGRGGQGRHRLQVPQHRADLRLRQPPAGPERRL